MVNAYETTRRLHRPDILASLLSLFASDRLSRAAGQTPAVIPVTDSNPMVPSSLPSAEAFAFYTGCEKKLEGKWKNEVKVRSIEECGSYDALLVVQRISPTPLLMVVAKNDVTTPTDLALNAYHKALEPKQLLLLPCGHVEVYSGSNFAPNVEKQIKFLRENLL